MAIVLDVVEIVWGGSLFAVTSYAAVMLSSPATRARLWAEHGRSDRVTGR